MKRFRAMLLAVLLLASVIILPQEAVAGTDPITVRLHYHRPDGNCEGYDVWLWDLDGITKLSPPYSLTVNQAGTEAVCEFYVRPGTSRIGYIIRKNRWEYQDVGYDQHINITGVLSGTVDFYVESGVPTQPSMNDTPTRDELISSGNLVLGTDVTTGMTIVSAKYKVNYSGVPEVDVMLAGEYDRDSFSALDFQITNRNGDSVSVEKIRWGGQHCYLSLDKTLDCYSGFALTLQGKNCLIQVPEPEFVLGDVNCDGKVSMKDWAMLYDYISEVRSLEGVQLIRADVTQDNKVNMKDWARLYSHITEEAPLEKNDTTLKVWVSPELYDTVWLSNRLAAFEQEHPEYRITWVTEAWDESNAVRLVIQDPTAAADVFMYSSDQIGVLNEDNLLAKLDEKYKNQVCNNNASIMYQSVTYSDGEIYGFPMTPSTWFMYYNKSIYTEADIQSMETMLSKGRIAFDLGNAWYNGAFFFGAGATLYGANGIDAAAGVDFNGTTGDAVARKMAEMYHTGNLVDGRNGSDKVLFLKEYVGAIFSDSAYYDELKSAMGDNLGVAILPTFTVDGQTYRMNAFASANAFGVNNTINNAEKKALAMELAAFLTSEESQLECFTSCGSTPAHKNLSGNAAVKDDPVSAVMLQVVNECAIMLPCIPAMESYRKNMAVFGNNIINLAITVDNAAAMLAQVAYWINTSN